MPLNENDIKAELSYAYLHAVAARAGFGCEYTNRHSDNAGIDAYLRVKERLAKHSIHTNFLIEIQLKATSKNAPLEQGRYSFWMEDIERYNDLRKATAPMPKLLAVLFLPSDPASWLGHSEQELITRRCVYWVSLLEAPSSKNKSGQTVYLPQCNVLSVEGLRSLAERLSREEKITYVP